MTVVDVLFPMALTCKTSYRITKDDMASIHIGVFVRAPLGNRTLLGIVHAVHNNFETSNLQKLKFITSIESHLTSVSHNRIKLWEWIGEYYLCTLGQVMKAAAVPIPPMRHLPNFEKVSTSLPDIPQLSHNLKETFDQMVLHLQPSKVVLLKSVFKKTETYLHLLRHYLTLGTSVLILLPEIGVSEQFYQQLQQLFGEQAFLLHSGLTSAQRRYLIQKMSLLRNPFIAIGLRSSLLQIDLEMFGLIIVDEEQDISYKQTDPSPRFHARDVAVMAGRLYHIPVLLGTSNASFESEYNVQSTKYQVITIEDSKNTKTNSVVVDTIRASRKKEMKGMISLTLLDALNQNLHRQKQALLFCKSCTLLHEQVQDLIPTARIGRLDQPHTPKSLKLLLQQFAQKEIDLLIGSQTIHKGLDFGNIGIIGILETDKQLSRPDFRAHERAYQLFTMLSCQMEGSPLVVLQTTQANHNFFTHFTNGDIDTFLTEQLQERKLFKYPPFTRLIAIRFKHRSPDASIEAATRCMLELAKIGHLQISGPFASGHSHNTKLHTQLLWIHLPRDLQSEALKKSIYLKVINFKYRGGIVQIDVDPY
ncbi:MAG: hypothetical protein LBC84_06840 [Prevotellaceae bacterium]|jgi:primosomal protein N' (replication factor Y)|nr:hypothetical protein [Prevotellaceae bacterium]